MFAFVARAVFRILVAGVLFFLPFGIAQASTLGSVIVTATAEHSARVEILLSDYTAVGSPKYEVCWRKVNQVMFICWANGFQTDDSSSFLSDLSLNTTYRIRVKCHCRLSNRQWPATWQQVQNEFDYTFVPPPAPANAATVRLRAVQSGQCIFVDTNGARLRNWGCWDDPEMRFSVETLPDGQKQLRHVRTELCIWGSTPYSSVAQANICGTTGTSIVLISKGGAQFNISIPTTRSGRFTGPGGCLSTGWSNGGNVIKSQCSNNPAQLFVLDPA